MKECLLNLISLPSMEDALVDLLLEQSNIKGFSTMEINGHGVGIAELSLFEQVEGRQKHKQFSIHTETEIALSLIEELKEKFKGVGLRYYILPLIECGRT